MLATLEWQGIVLWALLGTIVSVGLFIGLLLTVVRGRKACCGSQGRVIAFFHPNTLGGGGGERVLWLAVKALLAELRRLDRKDTRVVIYSGDCGSDPGTILAKAADRFGVTVGSDKEVGFVFVWSTWLLDPARYPVLTMVGQSLGSMLCAAECVLRCPPDVFVDTKGEAFTYPVAALLAGADVACYTHYPTITSEMTRVVAERRGAHNNGAASRSALLTSLKLLYYRLFAAAYAACGRFCTVVMANSSWTAGHLEQLWNRPLHVVFPPCNAEAFAALPMTPPGRSTRRPWVLSVGQFRPEKDHVLQLHAFRRLLELLGEGKSAGAREWARDVRLVLLGGVRNEADRARVETLKQLSKDLGVDDRVDWRVNAPFDGKGSLREALGECAAGLHCMWNEHFGISVVESQAAGCVIVAHDSGGPRMDIVVPHEGQRTGCRASTAEGFAKALQAVLTASQEGTAPYKPVEEGNDEAIEPDEDEEVLKYSDVQNAGRRSALAFADVRFARDFVKAMEILVIA